MVNECYLDVPCGLIEDACLAGLSRPTELGELGTGHVLRIADGPTAAET